MRQHAHDKKLGRHANDETHATRTHNKTWRTSRLPAYCHGVSALALLGYFLQKDPRFQYFEFLQDFEGEQEKSKSSGKGGGGKKTM